MENERIRIRVHRNVEKAEIRPKPPVENVSTDDTLVCMGSPDPG